MNADNRLSDDDARQLSSPAAGFGFDRSRLVAMLPRASIVVLLVVVAVVGALMTRQWQSFADARAQVEQTLSMIERSRAAAFSIAVSNTNQSPTGGITLSGDVKVGALLSVAHDLKDPDGLGEISYQWQSSADGATWTDMAGAVGSTIALSQAQVGQRIRVVAGYTDGHGTTESIASMATAEVANVNDAPTVVGEVIRAKNQPQVWIDPATLLANDSDKDSVHQPQDLHIVAVDGAAGGRRCPRGS